MAGAARHQRRQFWDDVADERDRSIREMWRMMDVEREARAERVAWLEQSRVRGKASVLRSLGTASNLARVA